MNHTRPIEFEIMKEPWNKYELQDNTLLKTRLVLTRVQRTSMGDGGQNYSVDVQFITVVSVDPTLKGDPNPNPVTNKDILSNVEIEDMHYRSLAHESNEYVLDDRTKIVIHTNIDNVLRSKLKDNRGEPIYHVNFGHQVVVKPATFESRPDVNQ